MARFLIRRLLWAMFLFIAVTVVTYVIFFLIPAEPEKRWRADLYLDARF